MWQNVKWLLGNVRLCHPLLLIMYPSLYVLSWRNRVYSIYSTNKYNHNIWVSATNSRPCVASPFRKQFELPSYYKQKSTAECVVYGGRTLFIGIDIECLGRRTHFATLCVGTYLQWNKRYWRFPFTITEKFLNKVDRFFTFLWAGILYYFRSCGCFMQYLYQNYWNSFPKRVFCHDH